jgi:hypothetical protein
VPPRSRASKRAPARVSTLADAGVVYDVRTRIMHYDFSLLNGPMREALERWEDYVLKSAKQ